VTVEACVAVPDLTAGRPKAGGARRRKGSPGAQGPRPAWPLPLGPGARGFTWGTPRVYRQGLGGARGSHRSKDGKFLPRPPPPNAGPSVGPGCLKRSHSAPTALLGCTAPGGSAPRVTSHGAQGVAPCHVTQSRGTGVAPCHVPSHGAQGEGAPAPTAPGPWAHVPSHCPRSPGTWNASIIRRPRSPAATRAVLGRSWQGAVGRLNEGQQAPSQRSVQGLPPLPPPPQLAPRLVCSASSKGGSGAGGNAGRIAVPAAAEPTEQRQQHEMQRHMEEYQQCLQFTLSEQQQQNLQARSQKLRPGQGRGRFTLGEVLPGPGTVKPEPFDSEHPEATHLSPLSLVDQDAGGRTACTCRASYAPGQRQRLSGLLPGGWFWEGLQPSAQDQERQGYAPGHHWLLRPAHSFQLRGIPPRDASGAVPRQTLRSGQPRPKALALAGEGVGLSRGSPAPARGAPGIGEHPVRGPSPGAQPPQVSPPSSPGTCVHCNKYRTSAVQVQVSPPSSRGTWLHCQILDRCSTSAVQEKAHCLYVSACLGCCLGSRLTRRWEASVWVDKRQLYLGEAIFFFFFFFRHSIISAQCQELNPVTLVVPCAQCHWNRRYIQRSYCVCVNLASWSQGARQCKVLIQYSTVQYFTVLCVWGSRGVAFVVFAVSRAGGYDSEEKAAQASANCGAAAHRGQGPHNFPAGTTRACCRRPRGCPARRS